MAQTIRTIVDAEGNVHVDLSGFAGEECTHENRRLNEDLAQLRLAQVPERRSGKPIGQTTSARPLRRTAT